MKYESRRAKAAVFTGADKAFEIRDFAVLPPPAGMARTELIASGVCGTDIHIQRGKIPCRCPSIIGHEFVGRISALPEENKDCGLKTGDAVIVDIAVPCGKCPLCLSGDDANCVNMNVTNGGNIEEPPYLYGGYAEVNYTPISNLVKIPDGLDPTLVCTFACPGPTALHAFALAERAGVELKKNNAAVVQGLGPVGLFAVMYLHAVGVKNVYAVIVGENEKREALAREFGAAEVLSLAKDGEREITDYILEKTGGLGADLVFEASGAPSAVPQGMQFLRNRGVYLIPGQYSDSGGISIQPQLITFKALHIIGSSQYSMIDVKKYLEFLCAHPELHDAIRKSASKYSVENVNEAFEDAKAGKNIKTMLVKKP